MDLIDRSRTGIARYFPTFTDAYRYARLWLGLKTGYLRMLDKLVEASKKDRFSDRTIKLLVKYVHKKWWGAWWSPRPATMLGNIGDRAIDPLLRRLMEEDDPNIRSDIAYIFATMREPPVFALIDKLRSDNFEVAYRAAEALIRVASKTEVDLSKVRESLREYVGKKKDDEKEYQKARRWTGEAYREIAKAISERKLEEIPKDGLLLEKETVKPPKKGVYRAAGRPRMVV